jgi:hypothetical protein
VGAVESANDETDFNRGIMTDSTATTSLQQYIELDADYYDLYEQYSPDTATIEQIRVLRPTAHVITPCRYSCSDCIRNLPHMARIAEHLPGWTWEVFESTPNAARKAALNITAIPTFIVYDREGGHELGRIIENPASGSLEHDLLAIVRNSVSS